MRALLWLALPVLVGSSRPADACSPPMCWPGGFVPGDGATIPANAPGLYWRPSRSEQPAEPSTVRLARAADPTTALAFTATAQPNGDYVLVPSEPLVAGTAYILEETAGCTPRISFTAGASAPLPTALGAVRLIGHGNEAELDVATAAGSCSATVDAMVLQIELAHAAEAVPWKDLFLYETLVDDQRWSVEAAINVRVAPGQSWHGRGRDLLFRICTPNPVVSHPGLAPGGHQVAFRATLPGVAASLVTPAQDIEVMCNHGPDTEDPNMPGDSGDGGGCSSSTPAAGSLVLLALAFLIRTRSGRRSSRSA